jgi:hypothetical protein
MIAITNNNKMLLILILMFSVDVTTIMYRMYQLAMFDTAISSS